MYSTRQRRDFAGGVSGLSNSFGRNCASNPITSLSFNGNDFEREDSRVSEIRRLELTADENETRFSPFAEQIARELGVSIGFVSLVLGRTQQLAAMYGANGWLKSARCTPIEWSFCAHVVRRGRAFIVQDTSKHPLLLANPLVTHNGIRCYAGAPLNTSAGITVGALAVMGPAPHQFLPGEIDHLHDRAAELSKKLDQWNSEVARLRKE